MLHNNDDSIATSFVSIALAANELNPDTPVVFHYFGPSVQEKIKLRWVRLGTEAMCEELALLENRAIHELEDHSPYCRRSYLSSQIRALRAFLKYGGSSPKGDTLIEAVNMLLGFEPPRPYELTVQRKLHENILRQFGCGDHDEFKVKYDRTDIPISDETIREIIEKLIVCVKKDVIPRINGGEKIEKLMDPTRICITSPKEGYPPCYYVYRGNGYADIALSGQHRRSKWSALRTLMHELYPGHHLYYLCRETLYKEGHLGVEATIDLMYSAETAPNEGIAETGYRTLLSLDEESLMHATVGITREHLFKQALYNVWYETYVNECFSRDDGAAYLKTETGLSESDSGKWLDFIDEWRLYYPAYPVGTEVLRNYAELFPETFVEYLYHPKPISSFRKVIDHAKRKEVTS